MLLLSKAVAPPWGKRNEVRHTGHAACPSAQPWKYELMHSRQNVCWQHGRSFGRTSLFQQIGHCSSLLIFSIISEVTTLLQKHNRLQIKTSYSCYLRHLTGLSFQSDFFELAHAVKLLINAIRTWASKPPRLIDTQHLLEIQHLYEQWLRVPAFITVIWSGIML